MTKHVFFGYGSLVNTATHSYGQTRVARLSGWRRAWVQAEGRALAYLSAERAEGSEIAGLLATVPGGDWSALDQREEAYDRHPITTMCGLPVQVYSVPRPGGSVPPRQPILLSYLDVVVQGYLQRFGETGVADFFATTQGWAGPVLDDRAAPRYPRAQRLSPSERALTDHHLTATAAWVEPLFGDTAP